RRQHLLRGIGPGTAADLRPRVRRRLPELASAGALLLAPLPRDRVQRARLSAVRRPQRGEGVFAGARGRGHPGRARRARHPEGPHLRSLHGRLRDAPLRPAAPRPRLVAGRRRRRLRQRARRARQVPQGHRGRCTPLRGRRDGEDRRDVLEGADPRAVHGQGPVRLARVPRAARGGLGEGPRAHPARRADAPAVHPGPRAPAREARRADLDHDRRRGRPVSRAGHLHAAQDPDGGARRPAEVGAHDQPGGARGVQPGRARLPHGGGRREVDATQPSFPDGLGRPTRGDTLMPLPLEGYTVLDLTRARSGPTAVRQLADMGANVIKIEQREEMEGDSTALGFDFLNLHRNKRSMTLDLKHPRGVEIIKKIAARADVVVENFRPDVKKRLGIDYEALSKVNPRLVYGSISGFGQTGPYAERPGYDQIAQGMGGLMSITGLPGQGPVRVGIPVADLTSGLFLAQGILVALLEREKSGKGQWVHTSLLQAMVTMLDFQAARWLIDSEIPPQAGNDHPTGIPTGVFTTADGHINIAASGQTMYRRLCTAIGAPELIDDPRFKTLGDRSKNRKQMNAEIDRVLVKKSSAEWIEALNAAGVPSG